MKSILIFSFLFFLASFASAQSNFKEGYIITNENDTVTGFVDFRTSEINSRSCRFRANETGEIKTYYPGEISGYRFIKEGKFYVSRNIEIEGQKQEVFLEYLLKGIVSLYYYVGDRDYYFVENEEGKMTGIGKKEDEKVYSDKFRITFLKKDNRYIGMLKNVFQQSQSTVDKLDNISYNQKDIINVTKNYHDDVCTSGEGCIIFETKEDKNFTTKKITVYGGFQGYRFRLNAINRGELIRFPSINSLYPTIGAQLNLSVPRLAKSVSFQLDVAFSGINGSTETYKKYYMTRDFYYKYDYKTLLSTNKLGVKYTHWSDKLRPTIEFGLSTIFLFNSSSTYSVIDAGSPAIYEPQVFDDVSLTDKALLGYYGAIGVDYVLPNNKALILRFGYESHTSFSSVPHPSEGSQIKALSLKLGYTF